MITFFFDLGIIGLFWTLFSKKTGSDIVHCSLLDQYKAV